MSISRRRIKIHQEEKQTVVEDATERKKHMQNIRNTKKRGS